jgi:hypothetical protein
MTYYNAKGVLVCQVISLDVNVTTNEPNEDVMKSFVAMNGT